MQKLRLGSLFDGIGGFPLAAAVCGIEPVWASEIEPFPIEVTRLRFCMWGILRNSEGRSFRLWISSAEVHPART